SRPFSHWHGAAKGNTSPMSWLLLLCVGVQGALEFSLILDQDAAGYKANKRAVEALQRGDAEKALARLNKALKKSRQSVQIQNSVGVALMYLAKRRSGRKDQLQAAATGAFRSAAELASEAAKAEDLEVALGNEALARRHLEAERLNRRGIALDQQNRWEEAAAQFRRALQVAPGDPWAANNLGTARGPVSPGRLVREAVMYKNATHRSAGWEEAGPLYADAQKLVEHALRQLPGNPAITKSLKEVKRLRSFLNAWRQNADLLQLPVPADMLRQVAVDNTLVCTWSGGGDKFAKMALNLFSSIRLNAPRWAPAFVVLALDVETESFLRRKGITTWLHETVDIYMTRWRLLAGLVAAGFEVLLTDTDVVFLSDPFPYFFQDADLEVMTDHLFPERDLWDARWRDEETSAMAALAAGRGCLPFSPCPKKQFRASLDNCELAVERVQYEVQHLLLLQRQASSDAAESAKEDSPTAVTLKLEHIRGALDGYKAIRKVLKLKEVVVSEQYDDTDIKAEKGQLAKILREMAQLFDKMEVHFYSILGVEDQWFAVQTERLRSWAVMNPWSAAGIAAVGGACAAGIMCILFLDGVHIFYALGLVSAPLSLPATLAAGAGIGVSIMICWLARKPHSEYVYLAEEAKNDIEKVKQMVEQLKSVPDEQFLTQLKQIEVGWAKASRAVPHHEDRLCNFCLEEGNQVLAPVKAPRCT
ncbi:unnamed protein product, partial [Effrenium voratum]